jgi:hypothetical protein
MATLSKRVPGMQVSYLPSLPIRSESYTTWLYVALAVLVAVFTVYGMWYAGSPR